VHLVRGEGELQALPAHRTPRADRLGVYDLFSPGPVRRDREEDVRIGGAAGRGLPPVPPRRSLGTLAEQFSYNHEQTPQKKQSGLNAGGNGS
jgi:hypothetical protein